ncbi:MAG TPA: extracellular solute-binding protein, partial [Limnochordia bacterium]
MAAVIRRIGAWIAVLIIGACAAVSASQVEITWAKRTDVHGSMEGGKGYVETVIEEFERLNPDIRVNFRPLTGDWINKLTTEMIAGTAPDVFE